MERQPPRLNASTAAHHRDVILLDARPGWRWRRLPVPDGKLRRNGATAHVMRCILPGTRHHCAGQRFARAVTTYNLGRIERPGRACAAGIEYHDICGTRREEIHVPDLRLGL